MGSLNLNLFINGHNQNMFLPTKLKINPSSNKHLTFDLPWRKEGRATTSLKCRVAMTSHPRLITEESEIRLSEMWREINGRSNWVGLLDPLNPLLRSELIRYGEMVQACYDAFDNDQFSKYCGSCRFKPDEFFENLGWREYGYDITSYIYSTCNVNFPKFFTQSLHIDKWSLTANWIGFVAVSNDKTSANLGRRDIAIAWRGTMTKLEWTEDFIDILKPVSLHKIPCHDTLVQAEEGFLHMYTDKDTNCQFSKFSAREILLPEVQRLVKKYGNEELSITITGHSLGSALAVISACDIAETRLHVKENRQIAPVTVFSFSGPRVGNHGFKERLEELGVKVLRVVNVHDKVPTIPGMLFNEKILNAARRIGQTPPWCYCHVGEELSLDHKKSSFLKDTRDLTCFHNLEAHLHLIDGYHGKGKRFWLVSGRDKALVNKSADFLKDDYLIPPNWYQIQNKGLVKNSAGEWDWPGADQDVLVDHLPRQDENHDKRLQELGLATDEEHH